MYLFIYSYIHIYACLYTSFSIETISITTVKVMDVMLSVNQGSKVRCYCHIDPPSL